MELKFEKENDGKWYVVLPDWEGAHEDLEMVYGADDLLEVLSYQLHTKNITFEIWTSKPDVPSGLMTKIDQTLEGATYQVSNCMYYDGTAWLCNVTKFVFGGIHPNRIYFRVVREDSVIPVDVTKDGNNTQNETDAPDEIEYKKIKVTAVNLDLKKSVTITVDMKKLYSCQTQDAVKKELETLILESKVFHEDDLSKLKWQGRKDVIDEWKSIHPVSESDVDEAVGASKYNLDRFLSAQESAYPEALEEMKEGHKRSHWIWYIFPQQKGLGHSYNSKYYGLDGIDEAKAYLAHPILGSRLREISETLLQHKGKDIYQIMGSDIDALKLETSMKLFSLVSPNDIFDKVLRAFF